VTCTVQGEEEEEKKNLIFLSELAATYKEDGNYNFKIKKYRLAIISYTEGLRQRCGDSQLESELYNNRAAAHFFLKNYR